MSAFAAETSLSQLLGTGRHHRSQLKSTASRPHRVPPATVATTAAVGLAPPVGSTGGGKVRRRWTGGRRRWRYRRRWWHRRRRTSGGRPTGDHHDDSPPTTTTTTFSGSSGSSGQGASSRPVRLEANVRCYKYCEPRVAGSKRRSPVLIPLLAQCDMRRTYLNSATTWTDWTDPWLVGSSGGAYTSGLRRIPKSRQLVLEVDLIPASLEKHK